MRSFVLLALFASAYALAAPSPQALPAGLPTCAEPSLLAAVQASGCQPTDAQCICSTPELLPALMSAIANVCDQADQAAVAAFATTYCSTAGVSSGVAGNTAATTTTQTPAPASSISPPATVSSTSATSADGTTATTSSFSASTDPALIIDTSSLVTATPTLPSTTRGSVSQVSSTSSKPSSTHTAGAPNSIGLSVLALCVAVGAMTFVFAEL